jgi:hypothetical protein
MMTNEMTFCGRPVLIDSFDISMRPWGSGAVCCWACVSIVSTRDSWWEVYAMSDPHDRIMP